MQVGLDIVGTGGGQQEDPQRRDVRGRGAPYTGRRISQTLLLDRPGKDGEIGIMVSPAPIESNMARVEETQRALLRTLLKIRSGLTLAMLQMNETMNTIRLHGGMVHGPSYDEAIRGVWGLVARGLAFIEPMPAAHSDQWKVKLTHDGELAANAGSSSPRDPSGFMSEARSIAGITPSTLGFLEEAVMSFNAGLYLASNTMLGVAFESAFVETADAFRAFLNSEQRAKFDQVYASKRAVYADKLKAFADRVRPLGPDLPEGLRDLDLLFNPVLNLFRLNRNKAGHPTRHRFDRRDTETALNMALRAMERMHALRSHFEGNPSADDGSRGKSGAEEDE